MTRGDESPVPAIQVLEHSGQMVGSELNCEFSFFVNFLPRSTI